MKVKIDKLVFGYTKDRTVINGIDLYINHDSIAVVGASGCGKSTLLRLISGLIRKSEENILTGSISINGLKADDYAQKSETSFMFQEATLFPNINVYRNIIRPLVIQRNKDRSEALKLMELVELKTFKDYLPSQLSGGMKTRVSLARTFVTKPKLLLLDEPFNALDIKWKYTLYRELEKLKLEYKPLIIIVTHDIQEALLLSNHVVVLGIEGKILKELVIEKPLPRVFELDSIKSIQEEYYEIQSLIMNDKHTNGKKYEILKSY